MTALIVIGCILLFLFMLLWLKATICIEYNGELALFVKVLFIKIRILPKKKKAGPHSMSAKKAEKIKRKLQKKAEKKRQKALEKKQKKQEKKHLLEKYPQKKKSVSEIIDIIKMATDIAKTVIKAFFRHLKIKVAHLHVNIATGDAATTAIAYGAVSEAAFYLYQALEPLDGVSLPKQKDFSINADYLSEESSIDVKIAFSIRVWQTLHIAFKALFRLIPYLVKNQAKKQKTNNNI